MKKEKDPAARLRFLAVYQAKRGLGARTIAEHTGYTPRWVHATLKRYNEGGPEALADFRHRNPGAKPKLTPEETAQVAKALEGPPPDGGLWTGLKLRRWVAENLGKRLSLNPIYRLLKVFPLRGSSHEMGFSLKVSRPLHRKADKAGQEDSKAPSAGPGDAGGGAGVRVFAYAYDEHRLGLKPLLRRVWARKGERPQAVVAQRYQWFYVCSFVEPESGANLSL